MIQTLKKIFGLNHKQDLGELIAQGAVIVDVRTKGEYAGGHLKGSLNIPLDQLESNLRKFDRKEEPIITCCASGMRSSSAKRILESRGFLNVHNGGSWHNLEKFVKHSSMK
jgi:phage shock protein E